MNKPSASQTTKPNVHVLKKGGDVYEQFRFLYQQDHLNATQLAAIYAPEVTFRDPVHTLHGLPALTAYFAGLGKNLNTCRFEFVDELVTPQQVHITWNMRFSHRSIAGGREQCLRGMTLIRISDNRIVYHEDCYDVGAMLYEHLPLLGRAVQAIKARLARH